MFDNVKIFNDKLNNSINRVLYDPINVYKPKIGITANMSEYGSSLAQAYSNAIVKAGGIPLIIPINTDDNTLFQLLRESIDGLLLSGGDDIYPYYFDEEPRKNLGSVCIDRDQYELKIVHIADKLNIPILGICRGLQILGVAYGSSMYQDINTEYDNDKLLNHNPPIDRTKGCHKIVFEEGENRLKNILDPHKDEDFYVNSVHHQALKDVTYPFKVVARSTDGIIEAIDAYPEKDILAVQWHPEQLVSNENNVNFNLFTNLIKRASVYHQARMFHKGYITLDSHTDTPMLFDGDTDIRNIEGSKVDLSKMIIGDIHSSVMVAYLPQKELTDEGHKKAKDFVLEKLSSIVKNANSCSSIACIARNRCDVISAFIDGKKTIITGIENGYAIGNDISMIRQLKDQFGIVYITLCHNGDNLICDSASRSQNTNGGLSKFGKEVVCEMEKNDIMVDISHCGDNTIRDVLDISTRPIVASHSSVRSLCNHPRNLTDEQIIRISQNGGVIQICLYQGFIKESEDASVIDAVNHIDYIVKLVGINHVGIGSDFDGGGELIGCRNTQDLIRITIELINRGYDENDLNLIWGGNFMRIMPQK